MEIHLRVDQDLDGRLSGTATTADGRYGLPFSGSMELLANVEALCRMGEKTIDVTTPKATADPA